MNENGKWQLAFWVITVICGVWLLTISSAIIVNDRLRACEDQRIELNLTMSTSERTIQYIEIIQRLTRIETKMEGKTI